MAHNIRLIIISVVFILLGHQAILAQENDGQLAQKYYQEHDYEKASVLYERLYKSTGDRNYFNYYIKSLISLKDFTTAEKAVKKAMRAHRNDVDYKIEYGSLLKLQGKKEKAQKQFNEVVEELPTNHYLITKAANSFISKNEYSYALQCYKRGAKILRKPNLFRFDLARLYAMQRDYPNMIAQYLDILQENKRYYNVVQNNLQYYLSYDVDNNLSNILKKELLKYSRKHPDVASYTELLVWLYLQEKKFNAAYVQVRALDMRLGSTGNHLLEFADVAMQNQAYSAAAKAFQTIIGFGRKAEPTTLIFAKDGLLEARYMQLSRETPLDTTKLVQLEQDILKQQAELPSTNFSLVSKLSELQAYYLDHPDSAQKTLKQYLQTPNISRTDKAQAELLLADVMLTGGDPWEAILTYARVEKANKHNEIGHEAKFRKTKVAFFTGDFQWAKAQLDILKASTTKLIANDAFAMSLLIKDNYSEDDSIAPGLAAFSEAQMLVIQKEDVKAITAFDSITSQYKTETIAEYALFEKAKLLETRGHFADAAKDYQALIETYAFSIWADDAVFRLAKLNEHRLGETTKAMELYKKLMMDYKGSVFIPEARKAFRKLRGDAKKNNENNM